MGLILIVRLIASLLTDGSCLCVNISQAEVRFVLWSEAVTEGILQEAALTRPHTLAQSRPPFLQVLSRTRSSASRLFPGSPLLPLFPGCTPTCPGLASGEFSLAGGLFSELSPHPPLPPLPLPPPWVSPLYRCWLITGTFSSCQERAAAVEHLTRLLPPILPSSSTPPPPHHPPRFLITRRA